MECISRGLSQFYEMSTMFTNLVPDQFRRFCEMFVDRGIMMHPLRGLDIQETNKILPRFLQIRPALNIG